MTDREIIKALRCSATVHAETPDCTGCPCLVTEQIPEEFRHECDFLTWDSCDPEVAMLAAADRLEELTK